MLSLASETPAEWATRALPHLDEILLDHAHCEKKAASTAVGLLFRYPQHEDLLRPLARLAREELAHFEQVLDELRMRGVAFRRLRPSAYAGRLLLAVRPDEPARLLDTLLCLSLIEARSCERMKVLAGAFAAAGEIRLAALYEGLLASEARHHTTYVDLASAVVADPATMRARLVELARHEAEILAGHRGPVDRLHV